MKGAITFDFLEKSVSGNSSSCDQFLRVDPYIYIYIYGGGYENEKSFQVKVLNITSAEHVCIYPTPMPRAECNTWLIFNSEFSF